MVAGATTDDRIKKFDNQQPAFTRTAAKYQILLGNGMVDIQGAAHSFDVRPRLRIAALGTRH